MHSLLFDQTPAATQRWIETLLTIPSPQGAIVDFNLFPQQVRMLEEHTGRDLTVKGRQTRASSLILAKDLRRMTTSFGLNALVMPNTDQVAEIFRDRIRHHIRDLKGHGLDYPIVSDSKDELVIGKEMQNRYIFASGEERNPGRAYAAQIIHLSETAHWPAHSVGKLLGGIEPSFPGPPAGWWDMESTPNGGEGLFYDYAQEAQDEDDPWTLHFYPWYMEPRYRAGPLDDTTCDLRLPLAVLQKREREFSATKEEQVLLDIGLDIRQILWRRWRERELRKTGVPFLQEYVESIEGCFITGEENYFTSPDGIDHLKYYRAQCADPTERLMALPYRDTKAVEFFGSNLHIWERPDPKSQYVGYMDLSEGGQSEKSDSSALVVLNAFTRHHAATLRLKSSPSEFATMACAVMQFYNTGLLGGERGGYGSAALERCIDLQYPNIYYHFDVAKNKTEAWIYPTEKSRDELLRVFKEDVFERVFMTRDATLVREMGSFGWSKASGNSARLKALAKKQRHDDMVISASGANFIVARSGRYPTPVRAQRAPQTAEEIVVGANGLVMRRGPPKNPGVEAWMF